MATLLEKLQREAERQQAEHLALGQDRLEPEHVEDFRAQLEGDGEARREGFFEKVRDALEELAEEESDDDAGAAEGDGRDEPSIRRGGEADEDESSKGGVIGSALAGAAILIYWLVELLTGLGD